MGKISGKSLAEKYNDFLSPCVEVIAAGKEIPAGEGVYLERVEVISSVGMEPDMAVLVYQADKFSEQDFEQLEKYLEVGQKMEIKTGYDDKASRIFLGYLHEVEAVDSMQDYVEYTLICLDVKGLMKKNSVFQISGAKKAQQILNDILKESCYADFLEKKKVSALPKELNRDCVISGETHYDWMCSLAAYLDYEFFCGRGELIFRKARNAGADFLELTVEYGLQEVRGTVTMTEQTGSIQVCGYNRKDEKLLGRADWPGIPGPFGKKIKDTLGGCVLTLPDMELETGEEATQRAEAVMSRRLGSCTRMRAAAIGIPELVPGICAEINAGVVSSLSGRMYVEEVRHLLDEDGYRTTAEGARIKA